MPILPRAGGKIIAAVTARFLKQSLSLSSFK